MKKFHPSFLCKRLILISIAFNIAYICSAQVQYSGTVNSGNVASAINFETQATGDYSFAAGYQSIAAGHTSFAIGHQSIAEYGHSFSIGDFCYSTSQSYSFGVMAKANADQSFAIGRYVETNASGAMTIGSSQSNAPLLNNIPNSLAVGFNSSIPTLFVSESEFTDYYNGLGKVGIGTSNPVARFQIANGDIFIEDIDRGIVMKSPDGNCWRGTLNNDGQLVFVKLADCISLNLNDNTVQQSTSPFKIFPNPASNLIKIQCSETEIDKNYTINLFDTIGKKIISIPLTAQLTKLNVSGITSGQYVLTISNPIDSYSEIVIIN